MSAPVYLCPRCASVVGALPDDGRLARHPAADGLPCIDTDPKSVRLVRRAAVRATLSDDELADLRVGSSRRVTSESLRRQSAWVDASY